MFHMASSVRAESFPGLKSENNVDILLRIQLKGGSTRRMNDFVALNC